MALLAVITHKDRDRDKPLDGSGATLEAITTRIPTIRIGVDKEIMHNPPDHVFLLKMITPWICLPLSVKLQMTKNARNTAKQADASNAESKATLFATVLTKRHALVQLVLFKSKMTTNLLSLILPPQLRLLLRK